MAEYAVMPKADYQDACDAVREKTGETEVIKSGEMGAKIRAIDTQEDLETEVAAQETLIAELLTVLDSKAAGSGDGSVMVTVNAASAEIYYFDKANGGSSIAATGEVIHPPGGVVWVSEYSTGIVISGADYINSGDIYLILSDGAEIDDNEAEE